MSLPRCLFALLVGAVVSGGCQERDSAPTPVAGTIELRGADGHVAGELVAGPPCRATFGTTDIDVGSDARADVSGVAWAVADEGNGFVVRKANVETARAFSPTPTTLAIMDPNGVAFLRVTLTGATAIVSTSAGIATRELSVDRDAVSVTAIDDHRQLARASHTSDLMLAAILTAPELAPEVRAMIACSRAQQSASPVGLPTASPSPSPSPSPTH